jgi:hypothetical protein
VLEKGITMTVEGKPYTDVIHTRLDLSYNVGGTPTPFGYYDYYLSKNVGIIKINYTYEFMGTVVIQTATNLLQHTIM